MGWRGEEGREVRTEKKRVGMVKMWWGGKEGRGTVSVGCVVVLIHGMCCFPCIVTSHESVLL